MSEVFFEYFPYYLISCVLSLLMIQWLINDIFIASIAGKYGKAFNKSIDIKKRVFTATKNKPKVYRKIRGDRV